MKKTLLALSVSALAITGAVAQDNGETDMNEETMNQDTMSSDNMGQTDYENLIRARDIIGGTVYTTNEAEDEMSWGDADVYSEVGTDWNTIGEIEDVIFDREGNFAGIVGEVGGFLDIADKHVFLPVNDVKLVPVDDGSYAYVTRYSEEDLESREGVDEGWWN